MTISRLHSLVASSSKLCSSPMTHWFGRGDRSECGVDRLAGDHEGPSLGDPWRSSCDRTITKTTIVVDGTGVEFDSTGWCVQEVGLLWGSDETISLSCRLKGPSTRRGSDDCVTKVLLLNGLARCLGKIVSLSGLWHGRGDRAFDGHHCSWRNVQHVLVDLRLLAGFGSVHLLHLVIDAFHAGVFERGIQVDVGGACVVTHSG